MLQLEKAHVPTMKSLVLQWRPSSAKTNQPTNQPNKQKKPNPTNLLSSGGQKSKIKVLLGSAPSESFREESVSSLWRSPVEGIPNLMNFTTKVLSFKLEVTGILNWQV